MDFSLTKRYIPALIILTFFIVFSHIYIEKAIGNNKELAKIINMSGKQRMLSQRLIILAQNYFENPLKKKPLQDAMNEILKAHEFLRTKIFTQKLYNIYFEKGLDKNLKEYVKNFQNLLYLPNIIFLKDARDKSLWILKQLDSAVKAYEDYANSQVKKARTVEYYMMILTLFVLLMEALFIFKPAAKKIIQSAELLIKKNEFIKTIVESNANAIIAIDKNETITVFNQKAVDIFGFSKDEMIGSKNLHKIIPEEYRKRHNEKLKRFLDTGKSSGVIGKNIELYAQKKDGSSFPIRIAFGVKYTKDEIVIIANITDITIEKKQQAIIMQQSKFASIGEMLHNISHHWRQPLSTISTLASGIKLEKEYGLLDDNKLLDRLDKIVNNTIKLSKTLDEFRYVFQDFKERSLFLISDVLIHAENLISETLSQEFKIYKNYSSTSTIKCYGYKNELSQVIIHILNNAVEILNKKNNSEKIINISLVQNNKTIKIEICDNGGGIDKSIIDRIFEPYFTTKHQYFGTGMGLYISNEIVRYYFKGIINATNKNFEVNGKKYYGACFSIEFDSNLDNKEV